MKHDREQVSPSKVSSDDVGGKMKCNIHTRFSGGFITAVFFIAVVKPFPR